RTFNFSPLTSNLPATASRTRRRRQPRILDTRLAKQREVGVGIAPRGEERVVLGARRRGIAGQRRGACQAEMRQGEQHGIRRLTASTQNLLELPSCRGGILRRQ